MALNKFRQSRYFNLLLSQSKFTSQKNISITYLTHEQKETIINYVNKASKDDLNKCDLSPQLKNNIISQRNENINGEFNSFEQLSDCKLDKLKKQVLSSIILENPYSPKELQSFIASTLPSVVEKTLLNAASDFAPCDIGAMKKIIFKNTLIADFNINKIPIPNKVRVC